ncbi:hypothetical protein J6590_031639 [Homalodisca vitripennis]|nr:hypothetical protein J6590_031639 [Homalodisca vitripennis]
MKEISDHDREAKISPAGRLTITTMLSFSALSRYGGRPLHNLWYEFSHQSHMSSAQTFQEV